MQTLSINLADIEIGERHRALSEDAVQRLSASMREIGLKQPITIRITDNVMIDGKPCDGVPVLVAGAHRLAAAKLLGWERIDCIEMDDDALKAELWEIAENLHRCDLTKEQRDAHIRRYAEVLAEVEAVVPQDAAKLSARGRANEGRPVSIARKIADATGLSDDTVRRALKPKPVPVVIEAKDDHDVIGSQVDALLRAWNRAGPEARQLFLEQIDGPVFDRCAA